MRHPGRDLPALDRVTMTILPGERVAVLGASGAGKTTLASVLLGLRAPDQGRLHLAGVDVAALDPAAWHAHLAWVPQDPAALRGTVREVVTLGVAPAPDDDTVWNALRAVAMDAEVAGLPDGLQTRIGPGDRGLSAGQRRRLAIARALLRDVGLVVLDEPTGDLDVASERAVRQAIEGLARTRSVVVLTHRVALAGGSDRVVVLDAGRVVESGPPERLREDGGAYAALVAAAEPLRPDEVAPAPTTAGPRAEPPRAEPVRSQPAHPEPARPAPALPSPLDLAHRPGESVWRTRFRQLIHLLGPHRRPLAVAITAGAVTPLAGVVLVAVSTYLISRSALQPNLLDLTVVIVSVRALSLGKGVSRYVERLSGHDVALRVVVDLRHHAYLRLLPQAPAGLARFRSGDVLARVVADVDRLQLALVRGVIPLVGGLLASVAIVLIGTVLLPAAGPVLLVGLLIAGIGVPLVSWRLARTPERRLAAARGQLSAELVELLQAAPELRLLGQLEAAEARVDHLDARLVEAERSAVSRGGGGEAGVQAVLGATALALVLVAVPAVAAGTLSGVVLASVLVLALAAAEAVGPLPMASRSLVTAATSAGRLRDVLDAPPPAPDPAPSAPDPAPRAPVVSAPELALESATATYPGAVDPAVHALTLSLSPGRRVAVVGRSGAGKSTLAALTVRFLDPDDGVVRLDGVPLTELAGDDVRGLVALSPQDAHVLAGTISDELRLAAPDADEPTLWAALAAARLDELVDELPDGLATRIGEAGSWLSGGQRHRLALARTLLVGAPLLVLDEPTADLDTITGRAFLCDALRSAGERGVLLLTHDLRALSVVDEVVVLDGGRVVARGAHEELLASDPDYRARLALDLTAR
ncbi:MAG: thiol reductant ABC exporter subunit CydC [Nitriliruptoraceae bacterium]